MTLRPAFCITPYTREVLGSTKLLCAKCGKPGWVRMKRLDYNESFCLTGRRGITAFPRILSNGDLNCPRKVKGEYCYVTGGRLHFPEVSVFIDYLLEHPPADLPKKLIDFVLLYLSGARPPEERNRYVWFGGDAYSAMQYVWASFREGSVGRELVRGVIAYPTLPSAEDHVQIKYLLQEVE